MVVFCLWIRSVQSDRKINIRCPAVYNVNFEQVVVKFKLIYFMPTLLFCRLKTENRLFDIFREYRSGTLVWIGKNPASIYLFEVNNKSSRNICEICSKLTIKTPERRHWRRSGVFIVSFEHISHFFLVFLLLNLNKLTYARRTTKSPFW